MPLSFLVDEEANYQPKQTAMQFQTWQKACRGKDKGKGDWRGDFEQTGDTGHMAIHRVPCIGWLRVF